MYKISEQKFKNNLLSILKQSHKSWKDGDVTQKKQKSTSTKTADLINDKLKTAIEIKDDTRDDNSQNFSLQNLPQLKRYAREARKKFRNYPKDFETILLIRTFLSDHNFSVYVKLIEYAFAGYQKILEIGDNYARLSKIQNKNLSVANDNIGIYLFYGEKSCYYLANPIAKSSRVTSIEKISSMIRKKVQELSLYHPSRLFKNFPTHFSSTPPNRPPRKKGKQTASSPQTGA